MVKQPEFRKYLPLQAWFRDQPTTLEQIELTFDQVEAILGSALPKSATKLHAAHKQSLAWLPLQLLNGLPQIPAQELRVPIDPLQGARHDVLLGRVDRPREGFHPIGPHTHSRRGPPGCLHHFVRHPAKDQGIGLGDVFRRVTMQVLVHDAFTMIAAPV